MLLHMPRFYDHAGSSSHLRFDPLHSRSNIFALGFLGEAGTSMEIQGIPAEYDGTVGAIARLMDTDVVKAGDPSRAGEILVRVVKREPLPTHLLLGVGAVHLAQDYSRRQIAEDEAWREVSISADFGQPYPVDLPDDGFER